MENWSGNTFKDAVDRQRELDEKADAKNEFVCLVCKVKAKEDDWNFKYQVCSPCLQDFADDMNHKHKEQ